MSMTRQRVLVAGATGYLGRFVAREFKSRGHFVRALVRLSKKLDDIKDELDEIIEGEITLPKSIEGICDGIDVVFSSIGITKQKDGLTFEDVDYQGNKNLLEVAKKAGVKKFIYVSVFNGPDLLHLDIVKAHEDFVHELKASGMDYSIIRPTGYFSDMGEYLNMAKKGRVYLVGSGKTRVNPIHGADLAVTCADSIASGNQEIDVGGPEVLTYRKIAEIAFKVLGKSPKITSIPEWLIWFSVSAMKVLSRHNGQLLAFFATMMTNEFVATGTGTHTIEGFFQKCAQKDEN